MSRAYVRLDPAFYEKKLAKGYPIGAIGAYAGTLCLAEYQPQRGRFRDLDVLRALLGREASKFVAYLIEHGDIVQQADGRLYVEGWDEWQEGDVTVADRMKRVRNRKSDRNSDRNGDRNADSNDDRNGSPEPTVTVPSSGSGSGSISGSAVLPDDGGAMKDAADAYYSITARFPSDTILDWLNRLGRVYGEELTATKLSAQYLEDSNRRTLLSRTEEALKSVAHKRRSSSSHDGQHKNCSVCAPLQVAPA